MRFYKTRNIEKTPQSEWLYEIFKKSMSAKIQAVGVIGFIYVVLSAVYYELGIQTINDEKPYILQINELTNQLKVSKNEETIATLLA
jgi:hypothetical protein